MGCLDVEQIARYISGELDELKRWEVGQHIEACIGCRSARDELLIVSRAIRIGREEFRDPKFVHDVLDKVFCAPPERGRTTPVRLVGRHTSKRAPVRHSRGWHSLLLSAGAAVVAAVSLVHQRVPHAQSEAADQRKFDGEGSSFGFHARGTENGTDDGPVSISVYRRDGTKHRLVHDEVSVDDYLAFSYTSLSSQKSQYLLVLGVDERGSVFWYYPEHSRQGENPCSVALQHTAQETPLPDEVLHRLRPGQLKLWALFSTSPLCVEQVERIIGEQFARKGTLERIGLLDIPGSVQQPISLMVREHL